MQRSTFLVRFAVSRHCLVLHFSSRSFDTGQEVFARYSEPVSSDNMPFVCANDSNRVVDTATNWTVGFDDTYRNTIKPPAERTCMHSVHLMAQVTLKGALRRCEGGTVLDEAGDFGTFLLRPSEPTGVQNAQEPALGSRSATTSSFYHLSRYSELTIRRKGHRFPRVLDEADGGLLTNAMGNFGSCFIQPITINEPPNNQTCRLAPCMTTTYAYSETYRYSRVSHTRVCSLS